MILDETKECINQAIDHEIRNAITKHGKVYSSTHEAWAILQEEVEEAVKEIDSLTTVSKILWNEIKQNNEKWQQGHLDAMTDYAKNAIAELCQVLAVIHKYKSTLEKII